MKVPEPNTRNLFLLVAAIMVVSAFFTWLTWKPPEPSHVILNGDCYLTEGKPDGYWGNERIRLRDGGTLYLDGAPHVFAWGECP